MNLRGSLRQNMVWRNVCGRFCFRRCLTIPRGNGRGWRRGRWWSGCWRMDCQCGWDCSCISLFGIRRLRECEVEEVEDVEEVEEKTGTLGMGGWRTSFLGDTDTR